jgi:hypothetical protein
MNNKRVTVKMGNDYKESFFITDDTTLDAFTDEVAASMGLDLDKTLRFVYEGFFVDDRRFLNIEDSATLICVIKKNTTCSILKPTHDTRGVFGDGINYGINQDTQNNGTIQDTQNNGTIQDTQNNQNNVNNPMDTHKYDITDEYPDIIIPSLDNNDIVSNTMRGESFNYKQVKASLIIFLDFIRNNAQIRQMYENDFPQLVHELLHNPTLETIVKNILRQSGQIARAIDNKSNIKVHIDGNDTNTVKNVEEIKLTSEDEENIKNIIDMGFDPILAVKTYIENNYDLEKTMACLLNLD